MDSKMNKQCAQCRRVGTKLFLKGEKCGGSKCALIKRNYPAGVHGTNRKRAKKSVYGRQLVEKQRAKEIYGLRERHLAKYMREAGKKVGNTGQYILNFLEARLDNVIFRMGLGDSRSQARQIVGHGHIQVNGKKVNIPSYRVKIGDVVGLTEGGKKKKLFEKAIEKLRKHEPVSWIHINPTDLSAKVLNVPTTVNPAFDVKLLIEFYARKI